MSHGHSQKAALVATSSSNHVHVKSGSLFTEKVKSKIYVSFFSSTSIICFHVLIVRLLKKETSTDFFLIDGGVGNVPH